MNMSSEYPTRSNINQVVQPNKMARGVNIGLSSESKDTDQLRGYRGYISIGAGITFVRDRLSGDKPSFVKFD